GRRARVRRHRSSRSRYNSRPGNPGDSCGRHSELDWRPLMEKMPYQSALDVQPTLAHTTYAEPTAAVSSDWRTGLPVLTGAQVVLRELRSTDASSLFALL